MSKQYAEFKVGDILSVAPTVKPLIEGKGGYIKDDEIVEENGSYPYIAAVSNNNGIKGWTNVEPENSAGAITLSTTADSSNTIFYQPVDYVGRQQIAKVQHKDLSPLTEREAMYIATLLRKITQAFNYGNKLTKDSLVNTFITLPITDDTIDSDSPEPDWEYMEEYIKEIEEKYLDSVEQYNRRNEDILDALHPDYHDGAPEAYDYAEFKVGELFDVNNLAYFDIKDVAEGNGKPLVSTRTTQNGYQLFSSEEEKKVHKGNVITLSAHSAQFFYQPIDFISVSHMYSISHEKMNRKIGMYLVSAFSKLTSKQFNFSQKLTGKRFSDMSVSLPVTSDGKPDWLFMEEYINFIEGGEKRNRKLRAAKEENILKQLMGR